MDGMLETEEAGVPFPPSVEGTFVTEDAGVELFDAEFRHLNKEEELEGSRVIPALSPGLGEGGSECGRTFLTLLSILSRSAGAMVGRVCLERVCWVFGENV